MGIYCLAHKHSNRIEEAICSLRFQRDYANAEIIRLKKKVEELEKIIEQK